MLPCGVRFCSTHDQVNVAAVRCSREMQIQLLALWALTSMPVIFRIYGVSNPQGRLLPLVHAHVDVHTLIHHVWATATLTDG